MRRLLIAAVVVGTVAVIVQSLPDIIRYKKIRDM
ncbi:DUF6893 family small protein [Streptosporangium sp. CA-135522]